MSRPPRHRSHPPASLRASAPELVPQTLRALGRGLLSVHRRLLNPPPRVPHAFSFSITPTYDITLGDVLANRYSAPLSAEDFENWLFFVEHGQGSVQNLYFLLWLDSYTQQYAAWKQHVLQTRTTRHHTLSWKQPSTASYTNKTGDTNNTNTTNGSSGSSSAAQSSIATQGSHSQSHPNMNTNTESSKNLKGPRVHTSAPPSKALAYYWHQAHRTFFPRLQSNSLSSPDDDGGSFLALRVDPILFEPLLRAVESSADTDSDDDHDKEEMPPAKSKKKRKGKRRGRGVKPTRQVMGGAYPPPDAFNPLRREIEARLKTSAAAFVKASCSNSGHQRRFFGICVSSLSCCHAAIWCIVAIIIWHPTSPIPLFVLSWWCFEIGWWGVLIAYNGVCPLIYCQGALRMWYPWEIMQRSNTGSVATGGEQGREMRRRRAAAGVERDVELGEYPVPVHGPVAPTPSDSAPAPAPLHTSHNYHSHLRQQSSSSPLVPKKAEEEDIYFHGRPSPSFVTIPSTTTTSTSRQSMGSASPITPLSMSLDPDSYSPHHLPHRPPRMHAHTTPVNPDSIITSSNAIEGTASGLGLKRGGAMHIEKAMEPGAGGEIVISDAYSADFSPSSSLVHVSLTPTPPVSLERVGECEDDDGPGANVSALEGASAVPPPTEDVPSSEPVPPGDLALAAVNVPDLDGAAAFAEGPSTHPKRRKKNLTYLYRYPPPPPSPTPPTPLSQLDQLPGRRHMKLSTDPASPYSQYWSGQSSTVVNPSPHSASATYDVHRHHYPPTTPNISTPTHTDTALSQPQPRSPIEFHPTFNFDFARLPTAPPPIDVTGDRRSVPLLAPLTSVSRCEAVERMHWDVIMRSLVWATVLSLSIEGVCIAFIVPFVLHRRG